MLNGRWSACVVAVPGCLNEVVTGAQPWRCRDAVLAPVRGVMARVAAVTADGQVVQPVPVSLACVAVIQEDGRSSTAARTPRRYCFVGLKSRPYQLSEQPESAAVDDLQPDSSAVRTHVLPAAVVSSLPSSTSSLLPNVVSADA